MEEYKRAIEPYSEPHNHPECDKCRQWGGVHERRMRLVRRGGETNYHQRWVRVACDGCRIRWRRRGSPHRSWPSIYNTELVRPSAARVPVRPQIARVSTRPETGLFLSRLQSVPGLLRSPPPPIPITTSATEAPATQSQQGAPPEPPQAPITGGKACDSCGDEKAESDFPILTTLSCAHEQSICLECVHGWVGAQLDQGILSITCPATECEAQMSPEDLQRQVPGDMFQR